MLFISQTLRYSFCACVRNTPEIVAFVIGNMKLVSFSLILDAFPPRPKMPFGQRHVAIKIYNICKGHFGSRGGKHLILMSVYHALFLYTVDCSIPWLLTMLFENEKLVPTLKY